MEVIVGNLPDENEENENPIIKRNEKEFLVNGSILIYELNQYFQETIVEENVSNYTTLSGFMMNEFGKLPKTDEGFTK
jgi:putative hemolysin